VQLKKKKVVKKAFFIRYKDPEFHIRLRFELSDKTFMAMVMEELNNALSGAEASGQVWKLQTDTYSRELERYGVAILESEKLFSVDSDAVLALLSILGAESSEERFCLGIRLVDDLLDAARFNMDEKIAFIISACSFLKADCNIDRETEKNINQRYRSESSKYFKYAYALPQKPERILKKRAVSFTAILKQINALLAKGGNPDRINHLVGSYIHMSVNRMFPAEQKLYEYLIYCFLLKNLKRLKNTS
jgi:thiopeptide-type bacteriocin biosynthesis protein